LSLSGRVSQELCDNINIKEEQAVLPWRLENVTMTVPPEEPAATPNRHRVEATSISSALSFYLAATKQRERRERGGHK